MTATSSRRADIAVFGTGQFAGRIVLDLAATTRDPMDVVIIGRNAERLGWLVTAANARAFMFGGKARFRGAEMDVHDHTALVAFLQRETPRLAVQTASSQPSAVIGESNAWAGIVAAGGLSVTAAFQAALSIAVGEAIQQAGIGCAMINCCFPDVVNGILRARGIDVLCGTGNVAILSNAFAGALGPTAGRVRVLAHYQQLAAWRKPATERDGIPPRVWIDDEEVDAVFDRFSSVKLTREPAIEISGASGVTLMQAYVAGHDWIGHAPGPNGLPGGYPVRLRGDALELDLPPGCEAGDAIAWNAAFEEQNGLIVKDGRCLYTGDLKRLLRDEDFPFADGFSVSQTEAACTAMDKLRCRLMA